MKGAICLQLFYALAAVTLLAAASEASTPLPLLTKDDVLSIREGLFCFLLVDTLPIK